MRKVLLLGALAVGLIVFAIPRGVDAAPPGGLQKWAVVVGIDRFQGKTRPNVGAVGDAIAMRDALVRNGWPEANILMLTDGDATADRIRDAFRWLAERSTDQSYSVFHYSGHVKLQSSADGDNEGTDENLWPYDNKFISDGEFGEAMRAVKGWLWVDIAGCEAAGFDDGISAPQRLFTASSQEPEKSYEHPDWKNSVFTGLMIEQAVLNNQGDKNGDGRVSVTEAFNFAAERAPQITKRQKYGPQHPVITGGDGAEWFFEAPPPPPPPKEEEKPDPGCGLPVCPPAEIPEP